MSGIAGIVSLAGSEPAPVDALRRMSAAQSHRGEHETLVELPGVALALRGHEPVNSVVLCKGDPGHRVACVADGRVFNLVGAMGGEARPPLSLASTSGSALLSDLWRQDGTSMCDRLRGQFAFAIWDEAIQRLLLARDHFGVCPLHWAQLGDWLLFASEIKALLASGLVDKLPDIRGIHHVWTFFGVPGPRTCFAGISALLPGQLLDVRPAAVGEKVRHGTFWKLDFPDHGQETAGNEAALTEAFESVLLNSLERRIESGNRIAFYSSGGLDSSLLLAMAFKLGSGPFDTYTFSIRHPELDESGRAADMASHVDTRPHAVELSGSELVGAFPRLMAAAESPVIDVSASALLQLAERAHAGDHTAIITGEGADELQAGYPWFRIQQRLDWLDKLTFWNVSIPGFRAYLRLVHSRKLPWAFVQRSFAAAGGKNAWLLAYMLMAAAKHEYFSRELLADLGDHVPLEDLELDSDGLRRWHPLNRSIYLGTRIHLPGLHLAARGDRATARSGIQGRYPFLDRDVFDFLAPLAPELKFHGLTDKYLQRRVAQRWLPETVRGGRKQLLHAPLDAFHRATPPAWVEQLLSDESLQKTGYFDVHGVRRARAAIHKMRPGFRRLFLEMGLVGVISTQLWHRQYFDSSLADLQL